MNEMKYKCYTAEVTFSAEDGLLVGQVQNIDALIMFSALSVPDLELEFSHAIDAYIVDCSQSGVAPEKPYKGSFNVRIGCEDHRKAAAMAKHLGLSLNEIVRISVAEFIDQNYNAPNQTIARQEVRVLGRGYGYESSELSKMQLAPAYPHQSTVLGLKH